MNQVRENTADEVRRMLADGMAPSDVARELNISRQLVHYHKSDKSHRRRKNMDAEKLARERARANRRYADKAIAGLLDE